ncbi:MAG: flagellar protein FlaG [bacterium]|nr:flagellar protein FlaG [bacterium]
MIETISRNENVINKGEGVTPSRPSSSSEIEVKTSTGAKPVESKGSAKVGGNLTAEVSREFNDKIETTQKELQEGDKTVEKELRDTIERLNEKLNRLDREIMLKVDKRIGKNYVSVVDKESQDVIREFPPKEIRSFIARFMEFNEKLAANTDIRSLIINLEV